MDAAEENTSSNDAAVTNKNISTTNTHSPSQPTAPLSHTTYSSANTLSPKPLPDTYASLTRTMRSKIGSLAIVSHLLHYSDGRAKVCMLIQYTSKLLSWHVSSVQTRTRLRRLSHAMSDARKGFRYFKVWEEWQRLVRTAETETQPLVLVLAVASHVCSILYYLCDHVLWIAQLRLVSMSNARFRRIKYWKNTLSLVRFVFDYYVDSVKHLRHAARGTGSGALQYCVRRGPPASLLKRYVEISCNMAIAGNGMRLWDLHSGQVGVVGSVSAVLACEKYWDRMSGELRKK